LKAKPGSPDFGGGLKGVRNRRKPWKGLITNRGRGTTWVNKRHTKKIQKTFPSAANTNALVPHFTHETDATLGEGLQKGSHLKHHSRLVNWLIGTKGGQAYFKSVRKPGKEQIDSPIVANPGKEKQGKSFWAEGANGENLQQPGRENEINPWNA